MEYTFKVGLNKMKKTLSEWASLRIEVGDFNGLGKEKFLSQSNEIILGKREGTAISPHVTV